MLKLAVMALGSLEVGDTKRLRVWCLLLEAMSSVRPLVEHLENSILGI